MPVQEQTRDFNGSTGSLADSREASANTDISDPHTSLLFVIARTCCLILICKYSEKEMWSSKVMGRFLRPGYPRFHAAKGSTSQKPLNTTRHDDQMEQLRLEAVNAIPK